MLPCKWVNMSVRSGVIQDFLGDEAGNYTTLYSFSWDTLNW